MSIYDPSLDSWAAGPPLPRAVGACRAAVHAGELHVFFEGGVFVYRGGAWEEEPGDNWLFSAAYGSVRLG